MERASNGRHASRARPKVHLVGIHSYRGGAGKTTLAGNLAFVAARAGAKVAVIDGDLQAPSLHALLGVEPKRILHSLSEFVRGQCEIGEVPIDLTRELGLEGRGTLHFLPASTDIPTTTSILFEGYDVARLDEHLQRLVEELGVELLILDTHLGVNRETLLSLAISDTVLVLLRPDAQERSGAAVLAQMAKKVGVPACLLVPNMLREGDDRSRSGAELERAVGVPVGGALPWCPELSERGCDGLLAARRFDHPFSAEVERIAQRLQPAGVRSGGEA